ncbi:hypothetical protein HpBT336_13110 [Helicobacter pylori]
MWFNFYEPESNRVVHDFAVEVGTFQAMTYTYKQSNSVGFDSSNSIIHEDLEKNKEDAIHKILNRMYAVVMKKAVTELTKENIAKYRDAIDRMKGFKSSMPQKK